ncbi:putative NET domain-containing protein [Seiridium unicorne]|uniref:NET domain-containing protein n=1 Tax=Seiridium unicorne TaxID=138068 RepID=A0ABR2V5J7_9PEZI
MADDSGYGASGAGELDLRWDGPPRRSTRERHTSLQILVAHDEPIEKTTRGQTRKRKAPVSTATRKMQIERKVKLVTEQKNIDKESPMPEFPMKEWNVKIYMVDQDGNEKPATAFQKVTYNLHPSFENPSQTFTDPPYTCKNEGWGEFEMSIDMYTTEKTKCTVFHDLNFQKPRYETIQTISIKNPSQALQQILRETGPVASDEDPKVAKIRKANDGKKRKPGYDYEKMAEGLTKLSEDDLLHVIQLIHDHKTDDTYTKNDMDAGEFSVDLFTLPEHLARMIWDFLLEQKLVSA